MEVIIAKDGQVTTHSILEVAALNGFVVSDDHFTMSLNGGKTFATRRGALQSARRGLDQFAPHESLPVAAVIGQTRGGRWISTYVMEAA